MEYNISNSEKTIIPSNPVLKKALSSNKMEENKDNYSPIVKFPAISPKPQNTQKLLVDKSNQIQQIFKKEVSSLQNIPNQADLMVSNMKMNPGVKYSDNIGNVKTNENQYNPQIGGLGSFEKPIRMSRSEYMELVKNQGNYMRKKYVSSEENKTEEIKTIKSEIVVKNLEKPKKNQKKRQFDIIEEKSQGMENDNSQHEENNQNGEVIDRVGTNVYQHNVRREENKGKKKNDNIIINNMVYLKELLLCD